VPRGRNCQVVVGSHPVLRSLDCARLCLPIHLRIGRVGHESSPALSDMVLLPQMESFNRASSVASRDYIQPD